MSLDQGCFHTDAQGVCRVKMDAEVGRCIYKPRIASEPPEACEGHGADSPGASRRNQPHFDLGLRPPELGQ